MKKQYFIKEYLYHSEFESKSIIGVFTLEIDYEQIERTLPIGASIKHQTLQTVIENGKLIVFGEYTLPLASPEEIVMTESIDVGQVLDEEGPLPSVN